MPTGVVRSCKRHWQFTRLRPFSTLTRAVNLRLTFSRLCCEKPRFIWHRPPGSMDGKGHPARWMAKAGPLTTFLRSAAAVERLWPVRRCGTVKYEDIYLKAYTDGWQLEAGLRAYFTFYNEKRFHQALAYQTPEAVFKAKQEAINQVEIKTTTNFVIQ